jgi:DNA-binding MarR family transcriptional regulator
VKLARTSDGAWDWHLSRPEWSLLAAIASMFPLVPPDYHQATRHDLSGGVPIDTALLRESLAAHTAELRARVGGWLQRVRSPAARKGVVLRLTPADFEHWLQVLNDVRVGSWIRLGCPDQTALRDVELTAANERHLFLMEFCGRIQARFLEVLDEPDDSSTD